MKVFKVTAIKNDPGLYFSFPVVKRVRAMSFQECANIFSEWCTRKGNSLTISNIELIDTLIEG